ncbi:Presequence protease 1, chloroplastic/mitochondrial [Turnera subulata]|uniref:Presequence protease 1, chloroplastic/mitochondrial n=1 Tax=Turnera subulata TaxID=218843 RepID=A0A9Q0GG19_9ROSI|nr:Presequence protease 1, chloroplastic/mitochondrial [Turnera subulata]
MDKTFLRSLSSSSTPLTRFFLSRKSSSFSSSSFSSPSYYSSPVALPRHSLLCRRNVRSPDSLSPLHFHINSYNRHFSSLPSPAVAPAPADAVEIPTEVVEKFGFEKVSEEFIGECNSKAVLFRHKKTGAQVMSVSNDDENKVFGIVFRTPPKDSTGIFHVLGRSVLLGSKKYPLTGTLPQLSKGSLHTFLNAVLYPDRTCYPVASPNTKDFYNLVDVYLDAVFFPYCVRDYLIFLQEAWHFPAEISSFRGVLVSKMKGLYAQPDYILRRASQQALFPDNAYGFDSAGDPKVIPKLTFEQFKEFHRKYYHPSNARIWFYGDDNPTERLRILSEYLDMFEASSAPTDSTIEPQKLFSEPIRIVEKYPSGDGGDLKEKHLVCINWLLSDKPLDLETEITLRFLDHLILRTPASPLRKVLLENGLREAIIDGGIEDELLQPQFSIWLKGVSSDDIQKVEELIMNLFVKLAEEGFETDVVEASVNAIEFSLRENNTQSFPRGSSLSFLSGKTTPRTTDKLAKEGFEIDALEASMSKIEFPSRENNTKSFPRGLSLMLRSIGKWIYDLNPFTPLRYEKPLMELNAKIAKKGYDAVFSPLIEKFILNNSHRVTVELQPDPLKASSDEEAEREILEKVKASKTSNDLLELAHARMQLMKVRYYTEICKDADVLDSVPSLSLLDLPKEPVHVPSEVGDINGVKVLQHDLFTNDFLYSEVVFNMRSLKEELLPLVPLFCESLLEMGTKDLTSVQLNQLIGRKTGGISIYPFTSSVWGQRDPCSHIIVRGKVMAGRSEDLFNMINYVLQEVQFTDQPRFKQLVSQSKARMENTLRSMGYSIAAARMNAMLNTAGWISEQMGGVSYLEYLRALEEKVDQDWVGISSSLEEIRRSMLSRNGCLVNMTADGKTLAHSEKHVSKFLDCLPSNSSVATASWINDRLAPGNEAILVPDQPKNNNYIGKAANLYDTGYQLDGSAYVILKYISHEWLSDGRYFGRGFCDFDAHSGVFSFLSFEQHQLMDALKVCDRTVDFLRETLYDDPLTRAIIRTIRDVDAYQLPDAKGYSSLLRYLRGITEEERKRRQEEILSTSEEDFEEFASVIESVKDKWVSVAVGCPQTVNFLEWDLVNYFQARKAL